MTETAFCYHCRRHHPIDEMRQIQTRSGKRWRCVRSIGGPKTSAAERDAFGKTISDHNRSLKSWQAKRPIPHCVRDVFGEKPLVAGSGA